MKYILSLLLTLLPFAAGAQDTHIPGNLYVGGGGAFTGSVTAANFTNAGLTATRVPFAGVGGLLTDSANLTFDSGTNTLTTVNAAISGLTANRIPYASAGGLLTDSNALRFTSGTGTLTATLFSGALNGTVGANTPASGVFTSLTDSALTITRVPYAGTGGQLLDSASMFFNSGTGELSATKFAGALNGTVGATTRASGSFTDLSASSQTSLAAGSAGLPGVYFSTDTTSGLYRPAANQIGISTSAAEIARFVGYGLGLGISDPTAYGDANTRLAVVRQTSGTNDINIRWGTTTVKAIAFVNDSGTPSAGIGTTSNHPFNVLTNGATVATFSTTGKLSVTSIADINNNLIVSSTAPSIASGFGTSPACTVCNNTAAFQITTGTGGTSYQGQLTMPSASNGWACTATEIGAGLSHTVQTSISPTDVQFTNFNSTTNAFQPWGVGSYILIKCIAF